MHSLFFILFLVCSEVLSDVYEVTQIDWVLSLSGSRRQVLRSSSKFRNEPTVFILIIFALRFRQTCCTNV